MLELPTLTPFTVEPETVAILRLLEEKLPPLKLAGEEAIVELPWVMEELTKLTEPAGQVPEVTL